MTRARQLADLLDGSGDVKSDALDNVAPSNDASALTTGTLADGRFPATLPAASAANLTDVNAAALTGTIPDAQFPAVLPAISAENLTGISAFASGMLLPTATISAPAGWLMANGEAVSRTTYADLFTAIGSTYGAGDGATTFNLPDLRGRTIAGKDDMGGTSADRLTAQSGGVDGDTLGANGGGETHQLTEAQMPSHQHALRRHLTGGSTYGSIAIQPNMRTNVNYTSAASQGTATAGSNQAHNNVQPTIILNYIIKT